MIFVVSAMNKSSIASYTISESDKEQRVPPKRYALKEVMTDESVTQNGIFVITYIVNVVNTMNKQG